MGAVQGQRRVVVTGLGIISPVGNAIAQAWDNVCAGRSGIRRITHFDPSGLTAQIAGEVQDFKIDDWMNPKEARRFDTFIHYGVAAGLQAIADSGIEVNESNAERIGAMVGSGIGGLPLIEDTHSAYLAGGARKISPFFVPG
jgi:3-oxoacyl-[acyl-carrier-protein] synthase II